MGTDADIPAGTRPVILRIKNPTPKGKGWWYWNGAAWSVEKDDAKVFPTDYDAAVVVYQKNFRTAVLINA
jgi:hypothetical protein